MTWTLTRERLMISIISVRLVTIMGLALPHQLVKHH